MTYNTTPVTIAPITDKTVSLTTTTVSGHVCDTANPCMNGCSCEASCRDENDYVCVPSPGAPFVGKNCEWPVAVQCTANNEVKIDVPAAAVEAFQVEFEHFVVLKFTADFEKTNGFQNYFSRKF